ncbi:MAG: Tad domain-containing protein [Betaproteobacteria bacterium]
MATVVGMRGKRHQGGAIAIMVGISIVTLVLMVGLVLDLSHLFIVKHELQNAADACALSGARELSDLSEGVLERATGAATAAGQANRVDLQRDAVAIDGLQEVKFSDALEGPYEHAVTPNTRYVRCAPHESNLKSVAMWFMQFAGIFEKSLSAEATARREENPALCAIPLALCKGSDDFVPGRWYSGRLGSGAAATGMYDWIEFSGTGGRDLADIIAGDGVCTPASRVDAQPGANMGAVSKAWNSRFGLYENPYGDIATYRPDETGYAFTPVQLDSRGQPIAGSGTWTQAHDAYDSFIAHRGTNDPYDPNSILNSNGKPASLPTPITTAQHDQYGTNRRLALAPVINCAEWGPKKTDIPVIDYACILMLSPIAQPGMLVQFEFLGLRGEGNCAGFPAGPGTGPVLVK